MVDYNGLENRRAERHRGFESLSLRNKGCKSASYAIYTLVYTQKCKVGCFHFNKPEVSTSSFRISSTMAIRDHFGNIKPTDL